MTKVQKLSLKGLAIGLGSIFGIYIFIIGIAASFGWGNALVNSIGTLYIGNGPSFLGALVGLVYAFIDGAIAGLILGWIYNKIVE